MFSCNCLIIGEFEQIDRTIMVENVVNSDKTHTDALMCEAKLAATKTKLIKQEQDYICSSSSVPI